MADIVKDAIRAANRARYEPWSQHRQHCESLAHGVPCWGPTGCRTCTPEPVSEPEQ